MLALYAPQGRGPTCSISATPSMVSQFSRTQTASTIGPMVWRPHATHGGRSTCYVAVPAPSEPANIDDIDGGLPGWSSIAYDLRRLTERYGSETDLSARVAIREECRARAGVAP